MKSKHVFYLLLLLVSVNELTGARLGLLLVDVPVNRMVNRRSPPRVNTY